MNYTILAYLVYLALMIFIIVFVGRFFYRNGRVFIINLFKNQVSLADKINHLLLIPWIKLGIKIIPLGKDLLNPLSMRNQLITLLALNDRLRSNIPKEFRSLIIIVTTLMCNFQLEEE